MYQYFWKTKFKMILQALPIPWLANLTIRSTTWSRIIPVRFNKTNSFMTNLYPRTASQQTSKAGVGFQEYVSRYLLTIPFSFLSSWSAFKKIKTLISLPGCTSWACACSKQLSAKWKTSKTRATSRLARSQFMFIIRVWCRNRS